MSSRPFAAATPATIDSEVSRLLREAEEQAASLISGHRPELDRLVKLLVDKETVDGAAVYRLISKPVPERRTDGQVMAPDRAARTRVEDAPRPRPGPGSPGCRPPNGPEPLPPPGLVGRGTGNRPSRGSQ